MYCFFSSHSVRINVGARIRLLNDANLFLWQKFNYLLFVSFALTSLNSTDRENRATNPMFKTNAISSVWCIYFFFCFFFFHFKHKYIHFFLQ